jgi:hypothetical protein
MWAEGIRTLPWGVAIEQLFCAACHPCPAKMPTAGQKSSLMQLALGPGEEAR